MFIRIKTKTILTKRLQTQQYLPYFFHTLQHKINRVMERKNKSKHTLHNHSNNGYLNVDFHFKVVKQTKILKLEKTRWSTYKKKVNYCQHHILYGYAKTHEWLL